MLSAVLRSELAGRKVLATDLDGTLLRPDLTIGGLTRAAIGDAVAAGIHVVFVTGRPPRWMRVVAAEAGHAGTLARLMARALDGWGPEAIAETMRVRRERKDVLAAWARRTEPPSAYLWRLRPEMNRLDPD